MNKEEIEISYDAKRILNLLCTGLKIHVNFKHNCFDLTLDDIEDIPADFLSRYQTAINELYALSK